LRLRLDAYPPFGYIIPMPVAILTLHLYFPGCTSLKAKRSRLKPILARLPKEFNLSAAEMDRQDQWQESVLACAMISTDGVFLYKTLQQVVAYLPRTWPDIELLEYHIEMI
jgi:uncharacterized protein YlxP (DUF503 family)